MEILDVASPQRVRMNSQGIGAVEYGDDAGLIVEFLNEPLLMRAESEKEGRPIYKDVPHIWIRFPGDKTREVKRPVDLRGRKGARPDPERFPRQWARFQNQEKTVHEGTPLEEWGPINRSLALTYKGINIFTVEDLSHVPDSALGSLGIGGRILRDKAIAWLQATKDSAVVMQLKAENEAQKDDIAMLKQQIAALATGQKRKPGRPKKVTDDTDDGDDA